MRVSFLVMLCAALVISAPPAVGDEGKDESDKNKEDKHWQSDRNEGRDELRESKEESFSPQYGYTHLKIPPGYYPPLGECRAWYPDRPPGNQPPPMKCDQLIPEGAWLVRHPSDVAPPNPPFRDSSAVTQPRTASDLFGDWSDATEPLPEQSTHDHL